MKKSIVRWSHRTRLSCDAGMTTAVGTLVPCSHASRGRGPCLVQAASAVCALVRTSTA